MYQDLSTHPAWMEFDLNALAANYDELMRQVGPGIKMIASLKANAYAARTSTSSQQTRPRRISIFRRAAPAG